MPSASVAHVFHRPITIDSYIIGSTVLSVFLWQVLFSGSFNFILGYVIVLLNCAILLAFGSLVIHRYHAYFLAGLALVSALAATITHNPIQATAAQIVGISIFSIYHYSVLYNRRISLTRLMEIYTSFAAFVAIIGFPLWIYNCNLPRPDTRFHSWFVEPSHYIYATLPAFSFAVLRWQRQGVPSLSAIILFVTYLLADSLTGFLGIAITMLLMADFRSIFRLLLICALVVLAALATYSLSENVQLRVNGAVDAQITSEVSNDVASSAQGNRSLDNENQTTLAFLSNAYVTFRAFMTSPIIGNGLGTHTYSYEKYAGDVLSLNNLSWGENRTDANSLVLRLLSETGILGIAIVLFLLVYFGRVKDGAAIIIRNAMIPYFAMRLLRFGNYFSMELYFFALIYAFNFLESRAPFIWRDEREAAHA